MLRDIAPLAILRQREVVALWHAEAADSRLIDALWEEFPAFFE